MDPRLVRSRQALVAAMIDALDAPDGPVPTITELCSAAGVSRPTFYQHFGDVPSLIEASALDRTQALFAAVLPAAPEERWEVSVPRVVRELLDGLLAHSDFYRRVLSGAGSRSFQEHVVGFLTQRLLAFSPLSEEKDRPRVKRFATFLSAGTTWLVVGWILDDASRPAIANAAVEISELLVTGVASQRHATSRPDL